jgi:hypothetical protein
VPALLSELAPCELAQPAGVLRAARRAPPLLLLQRLARCCSSTSCSFTLLYSALLFSAPLLSCKARAARRASCDEAACERQVVLSNFNHLQKLGPATFDLWTRILRHNPNSSLWLLKFPREAEAHLHRAAAAAGVAPRRILLTDKFPLEEHLRVKRAASLLLDTLEYNAHVSGLDALWAGLPLVTLAGRLGGGGWVGAGRAADAAGALVVLLAAAEPPDLVCTGSNMARRCGASFLQSLRLPYLLARTQVSLHPQRSPCVGHVPVLTLVHAAPG